MFVVRAPGRVNLIGDHTDYQDGFCLPLAIDRGVVVRAVPRADGLVVASSDALAGFVELPADGITEPWTVEPRWGGALAAVLRLLAQPDRVAVGFTAEVTSTVPVGSGLSSSAAFAVAAVLAATHATGDRISPDSVAWIARAAEQAASGVPCGVMDQIASVFGRAGHALLLDCRSLAVVPVAIPDSIAILVVHTGVARRLADSAYAARRAAAALAAGRAGVPALRDASLAQVAGDPVARHVVTENQRVLDFVDALRAGDLEACGRSMTASHASLRDDFRVSCAELDVLVDSLLRAGAYGARLTGAGFGGCAVAIVPAPAVDDIVARTVADYRAATGLGPTPFVVHAVDGAGVETGS